MPAGGKLNSVRPGRASTADVACLTFLLVVGAALIAMPLVVLNTSPTIVGGGLASHKQDAESFVYLFTFAVLLPLSLWA
ncbi:MAG: hypothetical protein M3Y23_05795, partial [Actinomycetota bacterium]|nr:hypothetical protein [Actinomycetota bacterium]